MPLEFAGTKLCVCRPDMRPSQRARCAGPAEPRRSSTPTEETIWSVNSGMQCSKNFLPHLTRSAQSLCWLERAGTTMWNWDEGGGLHTFKGFWSNDLGREASVDHNFLHKRLFFSPLTLKTLPLHVQPAPGVRYTYPSPDLSDRLFRWPLVNLVWLCHCCVCTCLLS